MASFFRLSELSDQLLDEQKNEECLLVTVQARLHHVRKKGNILFLLLRENLLLVQALAFKKTLGPDKFKLLLHTPKESILRLTGNFQKSPFLIETTGNHFEIHLTDFQIISQSGQTEEHPLPTQIEDLNQMGLPTPENLEQTREERLGRPEVSLHHRLDHRVLDLRSQPGQWIFRLRSEFEQLLRQFFTQQVTPSFVEIHTPKLIAIPSETGAQVFEVKYFERPAYLAQSPQLYKQMCINSDFGRVFELGPVYRAEKSFSKRHLCEFTGLDFELELQNNTYHVVFDIINQLFQFLADRWPQVLTKYHLNLEDLPLPKLPSNGQIPVLSFAEGVALLQQANVDQEIDQDLNHEAEEKLGQLVKEKYGSDLVFLDRYPTHLRPFYTLPDPEDPNVTRSYDLIFRGQEIASGAQRINDYQQLLTNMTSHGLTPDLYQDYLDSFKYGSPPHAGIGLGLERLFALYLDLVDVKSVTLFPRDPDRLTP